MTLRTTTPTLKAELASESRALGLSLSDYVERYSLALGPRGRARLAAATSRPRDVEEIIAALGEESSA